MPTVDNAFFPAQLALTIKWHVFIEEKSGWIKIIPCGWRTFPALRILIVLGLLQDPSKAGSCNPPACLASAKPEAVSRQNQLAAKATSPKGC